MKKTFSSENIYSSKSKIPNAGRGVFAKRIINKGELIEKSPFIEIPKSDPSNLKGSNLVMYFFYFGKDKERLALALGLGSLYNHSYKPNVGYKINAKDKVIEFTALRKIKKDEELTFDYSKSGNSKGNSTPLWFEV